MSSFGFGTTGKEVVDRFVTAVAGRTCMLFLSQSPQYGLFGYLHQTVVITGPSVNGVGATTAISLAHGRPARLILAGRSEARIQPVITEIQAISPGTKVDYVKLDLGSLISVRDAASVIDSLTHSIDVLINNAGIMAVKDYTQTPDGIELQFGTNYLGHFLLTNLLLPKLVAAGKGARIVNVSSNAYHLSPMRFDDYDFSKGKTYASWLAYAQSKTAQILFTSYLAERLQQKGITSFVAIPGLVLETNLQAEVSQEMFAQGVETYKKVYEGREMPPMESPKPLSASGSTTLVAALDPGLEANSGALLQDCQVETNIDDHAKGHEAAQRLWKLSNQLVGEHFEY